MSVLLMLWMLLQFFAHFSHLGKFDTEEDFPQWGIVLRFGQHDGCSLLTAFIPCKRCHDGLCLLCWLRSAEKTKALKWDGSHSNAK